MAGSVTAYRDFAAIPRLRYGCILADPPWHFGMRSEKGRVKCPDGAGHYRTMPLEEIKALPVAHLAAPDSVLALWATVPMLPEALEVVDAWGYRYLTLLTWAKRSRSDGGWHFGTGYWLRNATEHLILAGLGQSGPRNRSTRSLLAAPVREHSRKPDETYDLLEALCAGPYLELFARHARTGWDAWGDQLPIPEAA